MTSFVSHTSIDCHDAYGLSEWWKPLLGYVDIEGDPNEAGHEECMILDPVAVTGCSSSRCPTPSRSRTGSTSTFAHAPAPATTKSSGCSAWAPAVADRADGGTGWVVFADPEGNEFCVLRSEAERAENAQQAAGSRLG